MGNVIPHQKSLVVVGHIRVLQFQQRIGIGQGIFLKVSLFCKTLYISVICQLSELVYSKGSLQIFGKVKLVFRLEFYRKGGRVVPKPIYL